VLDDVTLRIDPAAQAVLGVLLAMILFAVALELTVADFRRVAQRPRPVLLGLGLQLVALPALTFLVARTLAPSPSIALGMMVVAACPGGSVSNFFTREARGDVALSVSLTAVTSVLAALTTPGNILLWASMNPGTRALLDAIGIDPAVFLGQTVLLLALPVAAGMGVRHLAPGWAARLQPPLRVASFAALLLFVLGAIAANGAHLRDFGAVILPVVVGHNALALGLGWLGGRLAPGIDPRARRALTIEVGIQNSGLGLVLLLQHFAGLGGAALVTAGWGFWHLITGMGIAAFWRRRPPGP